MDLEHSPCKVAKLQAGIKPTALCSAIDKENLIEFLLDSLYYLYNYYMVCALLSHAYHVTHHVMSYNMTLWLCDTFPHSLLYSESKIKEKKKKRNINNNLAILLSYDSPLVTLLVTRCQFILIAFQGLNMSSRSIIICSMYLSYSVMFWGYRKGSRANSN